MEQQTLVQVEIHGKLYSLRSGGDPTVIKDVARFVDEKMRQVAEQTETVDTADMAILAALNIASELFDRHEIGEVVPNSSARDRDLARMLDEVLA
ncbi:MAG: cell division protein ZapA [Acidobacteriota bacterium]